MRTHFFALLIAIMLRLCIFPSAFAQKPAFQDGAREVYFCFAAGDRTEIDALSKIISIDNVKDGKVYA
ncbi:MAG: hypothetical protein KKA07_11265, partial [Bacteroidetes bacterium]|nr:hypothetical protein [Bacteroidota bacterium]